MNKFVEVVRTDVGKSKKDTFTANGAVTRSTSGQSHTDLFAIIGSGRNNPEGVIRLFSQSYIDDKEIALRIALWARDIRNGAGERQTFRNILKYLENTDPDVLNRLLKYVSIFGRWDDLFVLNIHSPGFVKAAEILKTAIENKNGLAAKWTPRKGKVAERLRLLWNMQPKQYRKFLVENTNVVENDMCAKEWDNIQFDKLPSVASLRYQKAFGRNCGTRYQEYKTKLVKGEAKINSAVLFPHNIVHNVMYNSGDALVMNEQWKTLPDYLGQNSSKVLVMSDVSGSMTCNVGGNTTALEVSIALGLYTSERLKGAFKDVVLTFSGSPVFHVVKGMNISDRVRNLSKASWEMNTDLQKAFELVLNTGLSNNIPQADMPETILVISDMEFDACGGKRTNFGAIKNQYKNAGYKMPQLVFWNVNGRQGNNPVKFNAEDTCMISGYSPSILKTVLSGSSMSAVDIMNNTIMQEQYDVVRNIVV